MLNAPLQQCPLIGARACSTNLDGLVPAAGDEDPALGGLDPLDDLDGRVVLRNLLRLVWVRLKVDHARRVIRPARDDLIPVLSHGERVIRTGVRNQNAR